jgi:hypothetical protein
LHKFDTLDYLKGGNHRQCRAYTVLTKYVFPYLKKYKPVLAGTIPLGIDIEKSDLDVLCCVTSTNAFVTDIQVNFSSYEGFEVRQRELDSVPTVIANFFCEGFEIEIFGQNIPVHQQNGYRHMIIEDAILQMEGETFREKIIRLKKQGIKTEPAFAQLLGLEGDPYNALLEYGKSLNFI